MLVYEVYCDDEQHVQRVARHRALRHRGAVLPQEVVCQIDVREEQEAPEVRQPVDEAVALVAHGRREVVPQVVLDVVHADVVLGVARGNAEHQAGGERDHLRQLLRRLDVRPVHRAVEHQDGRRRQPRQLHRPQHRRPLLCEVHVPDGDQRHHDQRVAQPQAEEHRVARVDQQRLHPALERAGAVGGSRLRVGDGGDSHCVCFFIRKFYFENGGIGFILLGFSLFRCCRICLYC